MRHGTWNNPVRPDGGKKRKNYKFKAKRSPMYVPIATESAMMNSKLLGGR